jgi:FlaG/FlaF family flagellin (archaellin)
MKQKGISTIIATILILTITISLIGVAWIYISGMFTGKTSTSFFILDTSGNTVTIRNSGTAPITSFSSVRVDGNLVSYALTAQDPNLLGYWTFDEAGGDKVYDASGYSNIGNLTSMNTTGNETSGWASDCKFGSCLKFDGVNDYVNLTNLQFLDATAPRTFSAWIKPLNSTGNLVQYHKIIDQASDYGYGLYTDVFSSPNHILFFINSSCYATWIPASVTEYESWHYIVGTYNGTDATLYVDGNFISSTNCPGNPSLDLTNVKIGGAEVP